VAAGSCFHVMRSQTNFRRYRGRRSCFHVWHSQAHFRRYRGPQIQFSYFVLLDSFLAVPSSSIPVLLFGTRFGRYRGRRVSFSYFVLSDSFPAVSRASVLFSYFALLGSFLAVPRAPILVFMFYALRPVLDGTEGTWSYFHMLCLQTHFRRYRGRRVPFSYFALLDPIWAVPRTSVPVFMFCASVLIFSGTDDAQSSFHVLPPGLIFGGTKDIGVSFLCFAIPDSFWAVPRASGSVFIFCAFGLIFDSTDGARFSFMFCASGLIFDGIEGAGS
jgi:hypothetical protein